MLLTDEFFGRGRVLGRGKGGEQVRALVVGLLRGGVDFLEEGRGYVHRAKQNWGVADIACT